jgi:uncharacterized membrane protein
LQEFSYFKLEGIITVINKTMENYIYTLFKWFYDLSAMLCHQIGSRCLLLGNVPLPVCARCTGIYLGVLTIFIWLMFRNKSNIRYPLTMNYFIFLIVIFFIMITDVITGFTGDNNIFRFILGYLFGFVCFAGVLSLYHKWMIRTEIIQTANTPWTTFVTLLFLSLSVFLALITLLQDQKIIFVLLIILIFLGILILYIYMNMFIFIFVFYKEIRNRIYDAKTYIGFLFLGLLLFIAELLILATLDIHV